MYTLKFNKNTSPYATNNEEADLMFLKVQKNYFEDVFRIRGYIYDNLIYETLGIKWDPKWKNLCLVNNGACKFIFGIRKVDDGFEVDII